MFWKEQQDSSSPDMFGHALISTQKDCPPTADDWCAEEEDDKASIYVNLAKNKESYTAYEGAQVWRAIYQENCMIERL